MNQLLARRKTCKGVTDYIAQAREGVLDAPMRQHYHFMPEVGWMNDPNGLIWFRGRYHLFFQYNPFDAFWGMMHWGHAVSDDLMHWEYLPPALIPDQPCDDHPKGGCFSGSAIEHDGKLYLVYTGTTNEGDGFKQTQCVAWSEDGVRFEKYAGNPVLTAPAGYDPANFRDPRVFAHDGVFYMVVGAKKSERAQALLYRSEDLLQWEFVNVLAESRGELGYMWECPDFFPLGDEGLYVLMFSPMGLGERKTVYLVGEMDFKTGRFSHHISGETDWGFDCYAPQSFLDGKGRRLLIGWANAWDWMPWWKDWGPTYKEGWCGAMTLPREVVMLPDHTLAFRPVQEVESLRDLPLVDGCDLLLEGGEARAVGCGAAAELDFTLDLAHTRASAVLLRLRVGNGRAVEVAFDLANAELRADRNNADGWSRGTCRAPLPMKGRETMEVRVFLDMDSIEIFADGGRVCQSLNVFAPAEQDGIEIEARGGEASVRDLRLWSLRRSIH